MNEEKVKINPDILFQIYHPVSKRLGEIMIDTYNTEMETGDYSSKEAEYHATDQAKEELESEFEFTSDISEEELNDRLLTIFYNMF
jgi:hypothetical protein